MSFARSAVAFCLLVACVDALAGEKIAIAHRGASGYLPEHTLEAYAMAFAMGADYIEQDLVMSKDGRLVALHDIHLEATTDVEDRFPARKRPDGRWYAADFTLAELKTLRVHERLEGRFPAGLSQFEIPTFEEAIELIQGLNQSTNRQVGIYPELKQPSFHRDAGLPLEQAVLDVLARYGYAGPDAKVYVQCFEPESLQLIRYELKSALPLIQLISGGARQKDLHTQAGLRGVAEYADGIGPSKGIIEDNPAYVAWAHAEELLVHPYTIRSDDRPKKYASDAAELKQYYDTYDVDGLFTDFPDIARGYLDARAAR